MFRRIRDKDTLMPLSQAEPDEALSVPGFTVKTAFHQRHSKFLSLLCHIKSQDRISATDLPRFAAISSGECIRINASSVARTTLIGFLEP